MWKIIAAVFLLTAPVYLLEAQHPRINYEDKWKKIDSLLSKKGLTQSALLEVNHVYADAKKENNDAQLIKALLYKMNLQELQWEDAAQINTNDLQKEINTINEPAKSILESILAGTYWNYFQQNRWKLYDRTKTVNPKNNGIATWGIDEFNKEISELYLASIKNEKLLEQTKLQPFDAIIIKGNVRYLRPTLFDLLAHRALEYFKSNEIDINKPAYAFEINDALVFADKTVFAQVHFSSPDSSSLHFIALHLFQELILLHIKDAKPDALLDADIERIQFANQYGVFENKEELYTKALQHITDQYGKLPAAAQAWFLQAEQFAQKAGLYDAINDTANRFAYLEAKAICDKVMEQKDSSEGKSNCQNLLRNIVRWDLNLQTEKINVPNLPFRTLVSFRNFTKLYFRVIKLEHQQKLMLINSQWQNNYLSKLELLQPVRTFDQTFPETGDFQLHRAEIKMDALPVGEYALLASVDDDFSKEKNFMAVEYFYVSDIAYINHGLDYFVLHRESGQPIARADVQFWYPYYDQRQKRYIERKGENIITDKNGSFKANPPKTNNNRSFRIEVTSLDDHLFLDEELQSGYFQNDDDDKNAGSKANYEKENRRTFFFTDRSIYRPGQTIYFKGIVITRDFNSRQSKILSQFKTKVMLYDANESAVDSLLVTTNDFGSYSGKFKLPDNLLNGEFKISDTGNDDEQDFSVEEYKRPKFYVEYEKIKGSYRIGDSIRITGTAKAYAGNNIDGASVKYRVIRQARYPYPWLYGRRGIQPSESQEMTYGEMRTDAAGKFIISFKAIPDQSIKKELGPVFEYSVKADITDINGETRSAATTVPVAYTALNLSIALPGGDNMAADSLKHIFIKTENLSGEFEPSTVNVVMYKLRSPYRLIRERYWQQPDQFVMSKEEYLKYFPTDEYRDETKKESWEKTEKVFETSQGTTQDGLVNLNPLTGNGHIPSFSGGWYLIDATTKDKYGESVKNIQYFQLHDSKTGMPASPQYDWAEENSGSFEPGNKATINIGSSANNVFVIEEVSKSGTGSLKSAADDTTSHYSFFTVSNEKKSFVFPVTENDRGGFGINHVFVKDNRFYSGNNMIDVPWTNKELHISYETYRDKTLPGSEEKWKIKITGSKKEKVAAELLTGMYDASLDQFKPQSWAVPGIWENQGPDNNWNNALCFDQTASQRLDHQDEGFENFSKVYDEINAGIKNPTILNRAENITIRGVASQKLSMANKEIQGYAAGVDVQKELVQVTTVKRKIPAIDNASIQIRKNFNETAFFFPDLKTDSSGSIEFSFTMPEAVTQWKWMSLAHTRDLAFVYSEKNIVTQKQLMVQPNLPRFLREGDKIALSAKIVNLTDSEMTGQTELQLFDATTNEPVDGIFINREANQYFTAEAKQSVAVNFSIDVPYQFNKPIIYRIIARSKNNSDGEEALLPVLSNRMLVTEGFPITMHGAGTKDFKFEKLLKSGSSETLNHHALTVEYTANPLWYAVQALPYLMEYPYECAEQTFNRFYANALAAEIVAAAPGIKQVFAKWQTADTSALRSNLLKNQELKSLLLQETPWVLQAREESQQKKNIALLFDMVKMNSGLESALNKLQAMQLPDGGFSWFKGGTDDRYITQYLVTGIGHLKKMNAIPASLSEKIEPLLTAAIAYSDKKIKEDYDELVKNKSNLSTDHCGSVQVQYLYLRSFFPEYSIPGETFKAMNYYRKQSQQFWLQENKYMQAMIALSLFRTGDINTAKDILASLKQNAILSDEMGMYWKEITGGYYWYQSPVETEALIAEAFHEISKDEKSVESIKTWLLKQKQTQNWKTTKATADACYALLLEGAGFSAEDKYVQIRLGNTVISSDNNGPEAGTGYFKKIISGEKVKPDMGNINVTIKITGSSPKTPPHSGVSWGAVYWQYFENLDKITPSATPLKLVKKLFIERNTDRGPVLEPVEENATLKVGDKIKVRIELRADRDMEYVHMKDMRAACMEPVNVLSEYKWQGGLGYYESTKDASTSFFFSWLPKGTYVFEYPLFVTASGNFSNGVTSVQCMYAPEFTSNSEGFRINAE